MALAYSRDNARLGGVHFGNTEFAEVRIERSHQAAARSSIAEFCVRTEGGLAEVADAAFHEGRPMVSGPAVGFDHEFAGDAVALVSLDDHETLGYRVPTECQCEHVEELRLFNALDV